jgi:cell pole-organizing protein PopZ
MSASQAAPLPDPTLTSDMADQLLEPATRAAVRGSIGKLTALGIGNPGLTIEAMMRDMLRPMLKEWLDENLPSVVERMVEKEIARVSRGE